MSLSEMFYSITLSNSHINTPLLNKCSLRVSHEMQCLIHPTFFLYPGLFYISWLFVISYKICNQLVSLPNKIYWNWIRILLNQHVILGRTVILTSQSFPKNKIYLLIRSSRNYLHYFGFQFKILKVFYYIYFYIFDILKSIVHDF